MAKGHRGGRRQSSPRGGGSTPPARRQRRKERQRGPKPEALPTAAPGAAQAPAAGDSIMGGGVSIDVSRPSRIRRPQLRQRNRGGPRSEAERRAARGPVVVHDFRYVRSDLRWIAMTSVVSLGVVAILWAALRA